MEANQEVAAFKALTLMEKLVGPKKIFDKHFRPFKFIAVLDIIHAVTYVYAAAMAGRERDSASC